MTSASIRLARQCCHILLPELQLDIKLEKVPRTLLRDSSHYPPTIRSIIKARILSRRDHYNGCEGIVRQFVVPTHMLETAKLPRQWPVIAFRCDDFDDRAVSQPTNLANSLDLLHQVREIRHSLGVDVRILPICSGLFSCVPRGNACAPCLQ